jgi:NAD(P)-dependent dehydrogenase (short-subunit alcohol dehydrogenase family)
MVILVSGGTTGVGAAAARAAANAGARAIAVTGRRAEQGEKLAAELRELGTEALYVQADVADVEQAQSSVSRVIDQFGRIDGLVNAAGCVTRGGLLDTTPEMLEAHLAINLRGPFFLMQAVVKDMVRRSAAGSIVNIGSEQAYGGSPVLAGYVASKAGLAGLTRNAGYAHARDRIRINILNIGHTDTEGEDALQQVVAGPHWRVEANCRQPLGRLGNAAEIANMIVFLLSPASGVVTGSVLDWDQLVAGAHD